MNRFFLTIFILVFNTLNLLGQCECENCSFVLPDVGSTTDEISISGANNPTLGQNGQQLCQLCINMVHDAIIELNMTISAPDGSSVDFELFKWSVMG